MKKLHSAICLLALELPFALLNPAFADPVSYLDREAAVSGPQDIKIEFVRAITQPPKPYNDTEFTFRRFITSYNAASYLFSGEKNKFMAQFREGYNKIPHKVIEGRPHYQLVGVPLKLWTEAQRNTFKSISESPIFLDSMRMKTLARKEILRVHDGKLPDSAHKPDAPLYLLFNEKDDAIWGIGPQLPDGKYFSINEGHGVIRHSNDVLVMEPQIMGGVEMMNNEGLEKMGYLSLVLAHENGHAIMQEAYGTQNFAKIVDRSFSGIGHDVDQISNRRLSYVEGWGEAFEAFLSEKYANLLNEQRKNVANSGLKNLLSTMYQMPRLERIKLLWSIKSKGLFPQLVAGHLQSTRGDPIRKNKYLASEEPMDLTSIVPMVWKAMNQEKWEGLEITNPQQNLAKEGVVAYQFYRLLKSGRFLKAITVMTKHRPSDYEEFYLSYVKEFPADREFISEAYFESFHPRALAIQRNILAIKTELDSISKKADGARDRYVVKAYNCYTLDDYAKAYPQAFPNDSSYKEALDGFSVRGIELKLLFESLTPKLRARRYTAQEIQDVIKALQSDYAKVKERLIKQKRRLKFEFNQMVQASGYPITVDFGPELWLEFHQRATLQNLVMGWEGTIELNTATDLQIKNFIYGARYHESGIGMFPVRLSTPAQRSEEREDVFQGIQNSKNGKGFIENVKDIDLPGNWYQKLILEKYRPDWK